MSRVEAEQFIYREMRLLDERRFEEWLELFTEDGIYWVPIDENADPEREPSVFYDDSVTRRQRIYQLLHQPHYSQIPPSRTVHFVSNIEFRTADDHNGLAVVHCNIAVFELRAGDFRQVGLGDQRIIVGRCEYHLRHTNAQWRIALKKAIMIDRDLPLYNLSFIL